MKKIWRPIIIILVFTFSVIITNLFFQYFHFIELFSKYIEFGKITTANIISILCVIIGALLSLLTNFCLKRFEERQRLKREAPRLSFMTRGTIVVSGIKKRRNHDRFEVEIGNKQNHFRYVYAMIKNTGKEVASNFRINNEFTGKVLNPQEALELDFVVYEKKETVGNTERNYLISYGFQDSNGIQYVGESTLSIDKENKKAEFSVNKKTKEK